MKARIFMLILLVSLGMNARSQKAVYAHLDKAIVYLQGANLYYGETVNVPAGTTDFIFENISPYINEASLQASGKGAVVMDVKHNIKYKEKHPKTKQFDKEIDQVNDSIEDIEYLLKDIDNHLKVLFTEKSMLLNNRIIRGDSQKDSLPLLRDGMAFLREKLNSILELELKFERLKKKNEQKKDKLEERLQYLQNLQSGEYQEDQAEAQPTHQVIVTVFSENTGSALINFNYYIQNANWVPQYELQATSSTNNLQLKYFAGITQSSGLDWKNTALTLSTSNPNESNLKPDLNPWLLSFIQYQQKMYKNKNAAMSNVIMELSTSMNTPQVEAGKINDNKQEKDLEANYMLDYVTAVDNLIRTEYEIKLAYNISSDGKAHKVLINQRDIPMLLEFAAVPKICTDAFLFAKLTGWEDLNIIPGNARLYFDGAYIGGIYLNTNSVSDTLDINLGRDKSIGITRKKIKEKYKDEYIGDEKTETRSIEIMVKNTKNSSIKMEIEDQIPIVSGTQDIKVTLLNSNGASLDESTGKLTWNFKLGSKEIKKLMFTYQIKYPKNKPIAGL